MKCRSEQRGCYSKLFVRLTGHLQGEPNTIFRCVKPLTEVGDVLNPQLFPVASELALIPGDLALSGFEDTLSPEWPASMGDQNLIRPFKILTAFWQVMQRGATQHQADIIVIDVGPNLGAIKQEAIKAGMKGMQEDGLRQVISGQTSIQELLRVCK